MKKTPLQEPKNSYKILDMKSDNMEVEYYAILDHEGRVIERGTRFVPREGKKDGR